MDYLSAAWTAINYIAYPICHILNFILAVLAIIIAPLVYLSHYCLYACWYAFCFLGKFETLYIFFGIAAFVGLVAGMSLHYVSGFIISILSLDSSPEEQRGRTSASYRAEKQMRRDAENPNMKVKPNHEALRKNDPRSREDHVNWTLSKQDLGRGGNRFNTILEEEDSSDGF